MSINGLVPSLGGAFIFSGGCGIVIKESKSENDKDEALLFEDSHQVDKNGRSKCKISVASVPDNTIALDTLRIPKDIDIALKAVRLVVNFLNGRSTGE